MMVILVASIGITFLLFLMILVAWYFQKRRNGTSKNALFDEAYVEG